MAVERQGYEHGSNLVVRQVSVQDSLCGEHQEGRVPFAGPLEAGQQLGIEARPVQNPEEAVRGMDVVLTATNSLTPIFPESWVEPGTHVSSMGKPTELSRGLHLKANRIVVGSQEQERNYNDRSAALSLVELTAEGKLSWSRIPELGELVSGRVPGWEGREEINIFRESQGGYGDIAFATWIYEEALRRKLGREIEL